MNMDALIDTGFLYALVDKKDSNHCRVKAVLDEYRDSLRMPDVVLVELSYLLHARLGHGPMRQTIARIQNSQIQFESVVKSDLRRIYELLEQYADIKLDVVDASITTIAERLGICRILTTDQRDFRIIRPAHCDFFELLPD